MFDLNLIMKQLCVDNDKRDLSKHRAPSNSELREGKNFHSYILQPWHGSNFRSCTKSCYSQNTTTFQVN